MQCVMYFRFRVSQLWIAHGVRSLLSLIVLILYPGISEKYCDLCVCLFICSQIWKTTCRSFTKFSVQVNYGRGSVLLGRHCNLSGTSGFVDDVMFSHNGATGAESNTTLCVVEFARWRYRWDVAVYDCWLAWIGNSQFVIKKRRCVSFCHGTNVLKIDL